MFFKKKKIKTIETTDCFNRSIMYNISCANDTYTKDVRNLKIVIRNKIIEFARLGKTNLVINNEGIFLNGYTFVSKSKNIIEIIRDIEDWFIQKGFKVIYATSPFLDSEYVIISWNKSNKTERNEIDAENEN